MSLNSSTAQNFQPIQRQLSGEKKRKTVLKKLLQRPIQSNGPDFYEHAPRNLPKGWERSTFQFEGLDIPYHIARATQENAVVAFVSGLKPDHAVSKKIVKAFKKRGISVVWINYPNPGRKLGYMPFYKRLSHYFFTSPNSPFYTDFSSTLKKLIAGHSTGGQNVISLVTSDSTKQDYTDISLAIPENSFLDNANAAEHDSLFRQVLFTSYALLNFRKLPHETLLGLGYNNFYSLKEMVGRDYIPTPYETSKFGFKIAATSYRAAFNSYLIAQTVKERLGYYATYSKSQTPNVFKSAVRPFIHALSPVFMAAHNGLENLIESFDLPSPKQLYNAELPSEFEMPTLGQILETRKPGRALRKEIISNPNIEPACPMLMVMGDQDPFSSNPPQIEVAKALKTPFIMANSGHNSLDEDKSARNAVITIIEDRIPEVIKLPKAIRKTETPASEHYWPEYSRLAIARQTLKDGFERVVKVMPRLVRLHLRQAESTPPEPAHKPS